MECIRVGEDAVSKTVTLKRAGGSTPSHSAEDNWMYAAQAEELPDTIEHRRVEAAPAARRVTATETNRLVTNGS